ncbi:MAG: exo-alpha-sialidase [Ktedonobacteraceae bacterium]|nr:exo-alpha-sialidase [Ktedonobacteraceae bacterium]
MFTAMLLAGLSTVFALALPLSASGAVELVQVSSDPYANSTSQHQDEVEPDTYAFGSTIVSAFQVGRFYDGGGSDIGWATSNDSGRTWTHGYLPGTTVYATPSGPYDRISDPAVAYDAAHKTWLISSLVIKDELGTNIGVGVIVSRSTDGGFTWQSPVVVGLAGPKSFYDKDWIVCDDHAHSRFYGHCYVEWDDANSNGRILMSASTDGAKTWGSPLSPAHQNFFGIGGQPLVQPNGTVVVPITSSATQSSIVAFSSANGGASWSSAVTVAQIFIFTENATMRDGTNLVSAEIDAAGKIYVVWSDCRFEPHCSTEYGSANDIVMSTSTDGTTWSAPQRIPIDPVGGGVNHIIPGIGVDRSTSGSQAHLALTYYYFSNAACFTYNCQLYVGFISSTSGGASWSDREQLAGPMRMPWLPDTSSGFMVGDYISTSIVHSMAYTVFAVATSPSDEHLNEEMYTAQDLTVVGGSVTAQHDAVFVTSTSGSVVPLVRKVY